MNILIAEDDSVTAMAIQGLLTNLGHDTRVAINGQEALDAWESSRPPILVLDWMMPVMDGIEVCKRIRAVKSEHYTCIIMLTSKREPDDRVIAMKAGVDVFLNKPLNRDALVARIQVAERILKMEGEKCPESFN